jgi:hypothetical protein
MSINPINGAIAEDLAKTAIRDSTSMERFTRVAEKYKQVAASGLTSQAMSPTSPFDYTELSQKYDIRNCTFEEFCEIADELFIAGKISVREHTLMTFDERWAIVGVEGAASPFFTTDDMYGKIDWIAEYGARANFYFKAGVIETYASDLNILSVLKKLDR